MVEAMFLGELNSRESRLVENNAHFAKGKKEQFIKCKQSWVKCSPARMEWIVPTLSQAQWAESSRRNHNVHHSHGRNFHRI